MRSRQRIVPSYGFKMKLKKPNLKFTSLEDCSYTFVEKLKSEITKTRKM